MIAIDEAAVDAAAPNAEAAKNGRGLVLKSKFVKLHISADETILFGECQGSGKEPYQCSSDFARPDQPTHRCTCPSRQFPCKHCLGLMYAYVQGKKFATAEVPEDLQAKRDKVQARVEKKQADADKPKQVDKTALAKKIKAQLEGINVLEKLTFDLVRLGIGNMNAKLAREMEEQAKQLGNAWSPARWPALKRSRVVPPRCRMRSSRSCPRSASPFRSSPPRSPPSRGSRSSPPPTPATAASMTCPPPSSAAST
jgi:hypothetical protein